MNVKVCNLRDSDFHKQFIGSLMNTGFAVITHHGIDFKLIAEVQGDWRDFLKDNEEYKNEFINHKDPNMGYTGLAQEKAIGANTFDLKSFFHFKPGHLLPPGPTESTLKLYSALEDVAGQLLHSLNGLGSDLNYEEICTNSDNTLLRALYYPALNQLQNTKDAVRASAHEDINFLTLLVAASAPGLQVMDNNGNWHDVPFKENSIVVNVGDMFQLASKGMFKSTTHRVVNPENASSDRVSIPFFIHPKGDTILAQGITAQEFLNERLNAIYKRGYSK